MSAEIIDRLVIPPEVADNLEARKTVPQPGDTRQFPRRYVVAKAVVQYQGGLPAFPRPPQLHRVVVADISRRGLRFLHSEQLYPGELAVVQVTGGKQMRIEIARCRKLAERCFEVGVKFAGGA